MKRHVSGFTLLELILAMFLSLIVVTLIYQVYSNVESEWRNFYTKQNDLLTLLSFQQTLSRDIDHSTAVRKTGKGSYLITSGTDTIYYTFGKNILRKKRGYQDSFKVLVSNLMESYVSYLENKNVVKELSFDIVTPLEVKHVGFRKRYTASELVCLYQQSPENEP